MSWVISRYLCKSGNNNINYRIGNYNKFSYSKFLKCRVIAYEIRGKAFDIISNNALPNEMGPITCRRMDPKRPWMFDWVIPRCIDIINNNKRYRTFDMLLKKYKRSLLGYIFKSWGIAIISIYTLCELLPNHHPSVLNFRNYLLKIDRLHDKCMSKEHNRAFWRGVNEEGTYIDVKTFLYNYDKHRALLQSRS